MLTSSPHPILGSFTDCIGWKQWAGLALFVIGISMEMSAEDSRKKFKKDPKNKGKIDDTGLWYVLFYPRSRISDLVFFYIRSVVRHPNYLGFLLGRIGISLVTVSSILQF
jgi:steroid 5-alpha reductase family enzyme